MGSTGVRWMCIVGMGIREVRLVVLKRNTKLDKMNISGIRFSDMFYIILFAYIVYNDKMILIAF